MNRSRRAVWLLLLICSGAALARAQQRPEPPPGTIAAEMAARQETHRAGAGLKRAFICPGRSLGLGAGTFLRRTWRANSRRARAARRCSSSA